VAGAEAGRCVGYRRMISDDIRLSRAMADAVSRHRSSS
jgi:hypothetical protein